MKIEERLKSNAPLTLSKKTYLNIIFSHQIITEKMNEILKTFDISIEQFNVLRILRGQKMVPVNMSVLQERMIAKTSNTSRLVDKLQYKELVHREVCQANRRKMEVVITQKGLELLEVVDQLVEDIEQKFQNNLTEEETVTLINLLTKYRNI